MDNEWLEWKNHVLSELKRIDSHMQKNQKAHEAMLVQITKLQIQTSTSSKLYGFLGGLIPAIGVSIYFLIK